MKKNIILKLIFCMFVSTVNVATAAMVEKINIKGNYRISDSTIKSLINITPKVNFSDDKLDKSLKSLLASGYFVDVDLDVRNKELFIIVKENPTINKVVFEGNKRLKDEELQKEISSIIRSVYTKTKVQNDISRIIDIYSMNGRYSTKVNPKIVELDQNRVDLIFEITEGVQSKINSITFIGNEVLGDSKLRSAITSEESKWYKFFSSKDQFNIHQIEYDKELLARLYKSKGYANFQVVSTVADLSEKKDKFFVTFIVEEGKKYKFGKSDIKSNIKLDLDQLKYQLQTSQGDVYNIESIDKSINNITQSLNDKGVYFFNIDAIEIFNEKDNSVAITYQISEQPKQYIRFINIIGNLRTSDNVIRREFSLQEGDALNNNKLLSSERNLDELDYFSEVSIEQKNTNKLGAVDLDVSVKEKSTADIVFSGGYNSINGPIGMISVRERNLLGSGKDVSVSLSKTQKVIDFNIGVSIPYFYNTPLTVGFDLLKSTSKRDNHNHQPYSSDVKGGAVRASYEIAKDLTHEIKYEVEKRKIFNLQPDVSELIKLQKGTTTSSAISQKFVYDRRDSAIETHSGYIGFAQQTFAGIGGNVKFLKHEIGGSYYKPIYSEKLILEIFANAGNITGLSGSSVKIYDKFQLGGENLRGFATAGIGARTKVKEANGSYSATKYSGDSVGGNNFYNMSAELKYQITDKKKSGLFVTSFVDAGEVFSVGKKYNVPMFNKRGIRSAAGLGIGLITPMGPMKVTYAKVLSKQKFDQVDRFLITFKTTRF